MLVFHWIDKGVPPGPDFLVISWHPCQSEPGVKCPAPLPCIHRTSAFCQFPHSIALLCFQHQFKCVSCQANHPALVDASQKSWRCRAAAVPDSTGETSKPFGSKMATLSCCEHAGAAITHCPCALDPFHSAATALRLDFLVVHFTSLLCPCLQGMKGLAFFDNPLAKWRSPRLHSSDWRPGWLGVACRSCFQQHLIVKCTSPFGTKGYVQVSSCACDAYGNRIPFSYNHICSTATALAACAAAATSAKVDRASCFLSAARLADEHWQPWGSRAATYDSSAHLFIHVRAFDWTNGFCNNWELA